MCISCVKTDTSAYVQRPLVFISLEHRKEHTVVAPYATVPVLRWLTVRWSISRSQYVTTGLQVGLVDKGLKNYIWLQTLYF